MAELDADVLGSLSGPARPARASGATGVALALAITLAALAAPAAGAPPTAYYWYDGSARRALFLDETRVARFGDRRATRDAVIAPAGTAGAGDDVSPIFRDAPNGRERALPGGVIVTMRAPMAPAAARGLLVQAGAWPARPLGERSSMWLVAAPAGMPSLELANRLHESGRFASASPNWWQPRALK